MKRKITKIWCVGLVVAVLASMLMVAAPASAKPLEFTPLALPTTTNVVLADGTAGTDVTDLAVSGDGETIYAVSGTVNVTKSTNGGMGWSTVLTDEGPDVTVQIAASLVAVAPDDPDYVAIAQTTQDDIAVYISTNGASTWGDTIANRCRRYRGSGYLGGIRRQPLRRHMR